MVHRLPPPLEKRSFTVLSVSAIPVFKNTQNRDHDHSTTDPAGQATTSSPPRSFINASIPLEPLPSSVPTSKHGRDDTGVVHGAYVSVEHVWQRGGQSNHDNETGRQVGGKHEGQDGGKGGNKEEQGAVVVWDMATASDAKGSLPMGIQKLGIPGAVAKDVGLFLGWVDAQRKDA